MQILTENTPLAREDIPEALIQMLHEHFKEVSFSIFGDPVGPDWTSRMSYPLAEDNNCRYVIRGIFTDDTANIGAVIRRGVF